MGHVGQQIFSEINQLRSNPKNWKDTHSLNPLAKKQIDLYQPMDSVYKWNEALARAARHIVNDNACGLEGDVYGLDFIDVLARYYAYSFDEVYFTKITASIILDQEPSEPNVINFIDNILGQKSIEKSILRSPGVKYMGVGCSCAIENVNRPNKKIYTCIIATANHVVTKDIEERIP